MEFKPRDKILRVAETSEFFTKGKIYRIEGYNSRKKVFRLYDDFRDGAHYYSPEKLAEDFILVGKE